MASDRANKANKANKTSEAALRRELQQVEELIARARGDAADVHQEIGSQDEGPLDTAETSELFTATQEQEAVRGELELRRDELRRRLGID